MKELLKPGYVVKLRRNELFLIMQGERGAYLSNNRGAVSLSVFADDLTGSSTDLDIMCVYGYSDKADKAAVTGTEGRELIWERSECTANRYGSLNALVADIHQNAVAHGWWEKNAPSEIFSPCAIRN